MMPVVFSLGRLHLYSYGVSISAGVLLALLMMVRLSKVQGFPKSEQVFDMVFCSVFFGFLGARIYFVIQNIDFYIDRPGHVFAFWEGGLIFYGGLIDASLALIIFFSVKGIGVLKGFDFIAPYVAFCHAFGRIGCFLNGCCHGNVCDLPWAVTFPGEEVSRHPVQLYEAFLNLALFAALKMYYRKRKFDGQILAFYFGGYACIRWLMEVFRSENPAWAGMTYNQWISIFIAVVAAGIYLKGKKHAVT